ncbi:hypothetical protein ABIB57_001992 [Devosia sp. UYZn731]
MWALLFNHWAASLCIMRSCHAAGIFDGWQINVGKLCNGESRCSR